MSLKITHAKSHKPSRMLQWNAVDTSPDVGGQNVLETFEMAIWHKRRTAQTELEFSVTGFTFTYVQKYFLALLGGRGDDRPIGRLCDVVCTSVQPGV